MKSIVFVIKNMNKLKIILTILFFFQFFQCTFGQSLHSNNGENRIKNVLIIDSYEVNYEWSRNILAGIFDCFAKSNVESRFYIEHLDQRSFSETYTFDKIAEIIKSKYINTKFDVIFTSDNPSFNFIKKYKDILFPNTPIVFCGYNNLDINSLDGIQNVTGINEEINIEKIYDLVLTIHPHLEDIVFINSTNDLTFKTYSKLSEKFIEYQQTKIKIFNFVDINSSQLKEKLKKLSPKSAIIVFGMLNDENRPRESTKLIAKISPFPVYSNWDFSINTGIVGGIIIRGYDQGFKAADMALKILNGARPEQIPILMETPTSNIFDYNQIDRFNISLSNLPDNYRIINQPNNLWNTHRNLIIIIIIFLVILVTILVILIIINTQKHLFQKKLIKKENQLAHISNNLVNGFIFQIDTGKDGSSRKFTFVSDSIYNFIGIKPEELYADPNALYGLVHPEDLIIQKESENQAIKKMEMLMIEGRFISQDGIQKFFQSTATPHINGEGHLLFDGIIVDIGKLKKIEEELIHSKHKAEESKRMITSFLTNLSHEVRTPMNGIIGFMDMLKNVNLSSTERKQFIATFNESAQRFLNTLDDIILMSEIESSDYKLNLYKININLLMQNVFDKFYENSIEKSLSFSWNKTHFDPNFEFITDPEKLDIILSNLVSNAIKYTPSGSVEFGYEINDKDIHFFVKDTGIGIASQNLDHIFDRFVQAEMNNSRIFEGTGLGLSIAKAFVEMLDGQIWVESCENEGSTFHFSIKIL